MTVMTQPKKRPLHPDTCRDALRELARSEAKLKRDRVRWIERSLAAGLTKVEIARLLGRHRRGIDLIVRRDIEGRS